LASRSELQLAGVALAMAIAPAAVHGDVIEPRPARGDGMVAFSATGHSRFDHGYMLLGLAGGFAIADGLELSVGAVYWLGGDPPVWSVSPRARYFFWQVPIEYKPYVGLGFSHWFVGDELDDVNTAVARAGMAGVISPRARLSFEAGGAAELLLQSCDDCWAIYPEFALSVAF